jgi:branched-chain amino acid transport system permease protein
MVLIVASAASSAALFFQQLENGITIGAVFALVALGYTLVYGILELINFAHGDVFMVGTVVSLVIVTSFNINHALGGFALVGTLLLLIVVCMAFCGGLNVAIERVLYRPLRRSPRLAPLIAAIGASFVLENVAELFIFQHYPGSNEVPFPVIFPPGGFVFGSADSPVKINYIDIFIVVIAAGLMFALDRFIRKTKTGAAMRAISQDPEAAALMGVNVNRIISITFLIGGALAGAAGVIYNLYGAEPVNFDSGFKLGLVAFTAAVLGGIGNVYGAVLGGFAIGIIQSLAIAIIPNGAGIQWADAVVFAILVLILVFRPSGLLGQQVPDKA